MRWPWLVMMLALTGCLERRAVGAQCLTGRDCAPGLVCEPARAECVAPDADGGPDPGGDAAPDGAPAAPEPEPPPGAGPTSEGDLSRIPVVGPWPDPCPVRWPRRDVAPDLVVLTSPVGEEPERARQTIDVALARMTVDRPPVALCTVADVDRLPELLGEPRAPVVLGPLDANQLRRVEDALDDFGWLWIGPTQSARWTLAVPGAEQGLVVGRLLRGQRLLLAGPRNSPTLSGVEQALAEPCPDGVTCPAARRSEPDASWNADGADPLADVDVVVAAVNRPDAAEPVLEALRALPEARRPLVIFVDDVPGGAAVDLISEALADAPDAACHVWAVSVYADGPVPLGIDVAPSRLRGQMARLHDGLMAAGLALAASDAAAPRTLDAVDAAMTNVLAEAGEGVVRLDADGWPEALTLARTGEPLPLLDGTTRVRPDVATRASPAQVLVASRRGEAPEGWQVVEHRAIWRADSGADRAVIARLVEARGCP